MAKRLTRTVFVEGVAYGPASAIPAAVAAKITNPKVWADGDAAPAPVPGVAGDDSPGAVTAPAPAGADVPVPDGEATVKELRDYAKAKGVTLGAAKTKAEILKVLGLAEGEQEPAGADVPVADSPKDGDEQEPAGTDVPVADSPEDVDERAEGDPDGDADGSDSE